MCNIYFEQIVGIVKQLREILNSEDVLPYLREEITKELEDNLRDLEIDYGLTEEDIHML